MKIIKESTTQLILQEKLLGIWFLGSCTASLGFFFILAFDTPVDILGGLCIAIAIIIATLSPTATCTFDRDAREIVIEERHMSSRRTIRHTLTELTLVVVEPYVVMGTEFFRVTVVLASGQRLALTRSASTDQATQEALAERIRGFLSQGELVSLSTASLSQA